jgi:hypothetical protein
MRQKDYLTSMVSPVVIVNKKDAVLQHRLKNQLRLQESRLDKLMSMQDKMKKEIINQNQSTDMHLSVFERMIIEVDNNKEDQAVETDEVATAVFQSPHG